MPIKIRDYDNYEAYLEHQKEKTKNPLRSERLSNISGIREYFKIRFTNILRHHNFLKRLEKGFVSKNVDDSWPPHTKVLCLGARLGEEVRAFRDLGFEDAIGVDLVPNEPYVITADFHDLPFESGAIEIIYTNAIDHSCKPEKMIEEAFRCLKPGGYLIIDYYPGHMGGYEACQIDTFEDMVGLIPEKIAYVASGTYIPHTFTGPCTELILVKH